MVTARKGTKQCTGIKSRDPGAKRARTVGQSAGASESDSLRSRLARTRSFHRIGKCLQWSEMELEWRIWKVG